MSFMKTGKPLGVFDLPERIRGRLRVGTCSWNYPEWEEVGIYSQKQKRHYDYLPEYSKHFNTAEVDQWFWSLESPDSIRLPRKDDVQAYADLTPDDFRFTVKAPNSVTLTHFYKQAPPEHAGKPNPHFLSVDVMTSFLKSLKPLAGKIGVIMFEFEYLNKGKMPTLERFLDQLSDFIGALPRNFSYAIETRNPNYLNDRYFSFLKRHKMGHVFVEGYYMPAVAELFRKHGEAALPSGEVVIRLLGSDRQGIEKKTRKKWTEIVDPRDKTIKEIAGLVLDLIPKKVDVYANFNNHLEGSAPLSAAKFIKALSGK